MHASASGWPTARNSSSCAAAADTLPARPGNTLSKPNTRALSSAAAAAAPSSPAAGLSSTTHVPSPATRTHDADVPLAGFTRAHTSTLLPSVFSINRQRERESVRLAFRTQISIMGYTFFWLFFFFGFLVLCFQTSFFQTGFWIE